MKKLKTYCSPWFIEHSEGDQITFVPVLYFVFNGATLCTVEQNSFFATKEQAKSAAHSIYIRLNDTYSPCIHRDHNGLYFVLGREGRLYIKAGEVPLPNEEGYKDLADRISDIAKNTYMYVVSGMAPQAL